MNSSGIWMGKAPKAMMVGALPTIYSVVDVGKGHGHLFDFIEVVGAVLEVLILEECDSVMLLLGLEIDGPDFVTNEGGFK